MELLNENAKTIASELAWFSDVLKTRMNQYFAGVESPSDIYSITPPSLAESKSVYAELVQHYSLDFPERLVMILTLIPHIKPQLLDQFFVKNKAFNRDFTEFGGVLVKNHKGFIPTGETVAFILAGEDMERRFQVHRLFEADHIFAKHTIITLDHSSDNEPFLGGVLQLSPDYIELLTLGKSTKPNYSSRFPARLTETMLNWDELVLEDTVAEKVEEIITWIRHQEEIISRWDVARVIKPGYRALFYGPPGTGKTLTATLVGKVTGRDVYKIDLSLVVSKYVGETEKNLARIFDLAEHKNWILFFDEADALFGKRTSTNSSQERFANQEIAYLLQRTEDYPGIAILASNMKGNIDEAFSRRFQSVVYFPTPRYSERKRLWTSIFQGAETDENVDFDALARQYEISGGGIVNVLKYCAIKAFQRSQPKILSDDIIAGIKREVSKEGKTMV
ncbi:MAG: ATP-binding protein [Bacteroidetes bacterium]|nr:ATP-binding protein [Bacteroidota bacterium]MBU1717892.1 ATP-binding protein [Bacteroidota bacterium]